jgi:hypothetical protein
MKSEFSWRVLFVSAVVFAAAITLLLILVGHFGHHGAATP